MKLYLYLKSIAAIAAFTACFGLVHAGPVPSISDFSADLSKPLKFEFECPDEVKLQKASSVDMSNLSDRARLLILKEIEENASKSLECFVEITRDQINVNDMQVIPRSSVKKYWEVYQYTGYGPERSYYFMYASEGDQSMKVLQIRIKENNWDDLEDGRLNNIYLKTWMSLP